MRAIYIIITIVIIVILSVVLLKIIITDNNELTTEEIACAKEETYMILENPIEQLIVVEVSVDKKHENVLSTTAYAIGGIRYATVDTICGQQTTVTWRRWFGK